MRFQIESHTVIHKCGLLDCEISTFLVVVVGDLILRNTMAGSDWLFFNRPWSDYQQGFGTIDSLYWIGLNKLHDLSQRGCSVRFDLQALDGTWYFTQYSTFVVGDSADFYRLSVNGFSGDIYDAMISRHSNTQFSTFDYGPTSSCASNLKGGWLFHGCCLACLTTSPGTYLFWYNEVDNTLMRLGTTEVRFACWKTVFN